MDVFGRGFNHCGRRQSEASSIRTAEADFNQLSEALFEPGDLPMPVRDRH